MFATSTLLLAVAQVKAINESHKAKQPSLLQECVAQINAIKETNKKKPTQLEEIVTAINAIDSTLGGTVAFHGNTEVLAAFMRMREDKRRNDAVVSGMRLRA